MLLQIIYLLREILSELKDIKATMHGVPVTLEPVDEELLDNSDAKRLLKICDKTLYRWRKEKLVKSRLIGNKHYYRKTDLILMKERDRKSGNVS